MEMSPNQVRTASFATTRKGWDPTEVSAFLERAAEALESAQNHATAMEARARAAVAKLQELSNATATAPADPARSTSDTGGQADSIEAGAVSQAETISRTLLLAQRAADEAIAEAAAEAERIVAEARTEARRAESEERDLVRSEVDALAARRGFLQSDVEQLENFLLDQRERLRAAASQLVAMAERVPDGLGYLRPPLLSASDDDTPASDPGGAAALETSLAGTAPGETGGANGDGDGPGDGTSDAELRIEVLDLDDDAGERLGPDDPGSGAAEDDATPEGLPLRFPRHGAGDPVGGTGDDTAGDAGGDEPADRSGPSGR